MGRAVVCIGWYGRMYMSLKPITRALQDDPTDSQFTGVSEGLELISRDG